MNTPAPVLQNVGVGKPLDFSGYNQGIEIQQQNRMLRQREKFMAEQREENRKQQTAEFMSRQLADKNFGTGLDDDPVFQDKLMKMQSQAMGMAMNGSNISEIQNVIGPTAHDLNVYQGKAKFINSEIDNSLQKYKNLKGYDLDGLRNEAIKGAFYNYNPDTKTYTRKDINSVDPTTDWVGEARKNHPELASYEGLNEYIKGMHPSTQEYSLTTPTNKLGGTSTQKYSVEAPGNWMQIEHDDKGNVVAVPKYVPIKDDTSTTDGQVIGRAVPTDVFNQITGDASQKATADKLRSDAMNDLKAAAGKDADKLDFNDPTTAQKLQLHERALLYNELNNRTWTRISQDQTTKEGANAIKINLMQNPDYLQGVQNVAKAQTAGHEAAKPPSASPATNSLPDVVGGIYSGDIKGTPTTYNGQQYEDVTSEMPKGMLKYGPVAGQLYKQVLFNRKTGEMVTVKPAMRQGETDNVTHYPEGQMGQFITSHAAANGLPVTQVKGALQRIGFQNGQFTNKSLNDEQTSAADEKLNEENQQQITQALNSKNYDKSLKGLQSPDGQILKVDTHWFNDKHEVTVLKDGKQKVLNFDSKNDMQKYLTGGGGETQPAGKAKPATVVQNGNTYTLQPDGTYK